MAKILVTGGAGYIGSHLAWKFHDHGHRVIICDNFSTSGPREAVSEFELHEIDVRGAGFRALLSAVEPDVVIHCAAKTVVPHSVEDPGSYYDTNVLGSLNVVRAAASLGISAVLFSSTAAVYTVSGDCQVSEESPIDPLTPYGRSKWMSELMMRDIAKAQGMKLGILRYFNVAGADRMLRTGQSTPEATHLIKAASNAAILGHDFNVYGNDYPTPDGTCIRDFIDVNDLAEAHRLYVEALLDGVPCAPVYNCGNGVGYSVLDVVQSVERITGSQLKTHFKERRKGDLPSVIADASRLRKDLRWSPVADLTDMVSSAIAWEKKLEALDQ